jgi:regulator of protease activity HflC (stomatin/prohibitin superfamily)
MPTAMQCAACSAWSSVPNKVIARGAAVACPKCGGTLWPGPVERPPAVAEAAPPPIWRNPTTLGLALACLTGIWGSAGLLGLLIAVARRSASPGLIVFCLGALACAAVAGYLAVQLLAAKHRALAGKPTRILFGLAQLILWEKNEGLILLRDKRVTEVIDGPKGGGGLRVIYPVLGEELRARVPLSLQLTWFRDERVLTRESVLLTVKVAVWWKVVNIEDYFYKVSAAVQSPGGELPLAEPIDSADAASAPSPLGNAEVWVRTLAESCLRALVSETSTAQIVSQRAAGYLHIEKNHPEPPRTVGTASPDEGSHLIPATPDVIAARIHDMLRAKVRDYGLEVERVEVQEVQLPAGIQEAVDAVWVASTLPAKSEQEARARQIQLEAVAQVVGVEAAAVNEIVKNLPANGFFANPVELLQQIFARVQPQSQPPAPPPASLPTSPPPATPLPAPVAPAQTSDRP